MKKSVIVLAMCCTGYTAALAQKVKITVPEAAKTAFAKDHPGVAGKWEMEKADYEVNFKENGKEMSAVYSASGEWKETETGIATDALPAAAKEYLNKKYNNPKIKEAAEIKKADGSISYEAEVGGKDILFDSTGKPL